MKCSASLLSLAAAITAVKAVAFQGPTPTALSPDRALEGTSPAPTIPPPSEELKKRQTNLSPETCGWVDGVYSLGVTCPGSRTCMLYTAGYGMAGCCDGADTVNCGWATSCIDSAAYRSSGCGSGCLLNTFIRKCTEVTAPYCVTWSYPSDGIFDYGCAAISDSIISEVLQHATDDVGATTSMTLPTVAANTLPTDISYNNNTARKKAKKLAVGVIVGIVIVGLFVLFCVAIGILFCVKKRRKQRQIAASTAAMAAVQATRPQSQYPPHQQQQQQQQQYQYPSSQSQQQPPMQTQMQQPSLFHPSIDPQSPVSTTSYFSNAAQTHEEKPNAYTSVHEYASTPASPPTSNPSTPAPTYSQPHGVPPPMPVVSQYQAPTEAHEVDAVSVPHAPNQTGPVHEIGHGK